MAATIKDRTHTAFTMRREGKRFGRWLEIGSARIDQEGAAAHVFLDRLPVGGFTGYVYLAPTGEQPPPLEPEPRRPALPSDEEEEFKD